MEVGAAIRRIRKEARLTIDDLSHRTGLSRAYISQIETAKASPSLQTVKRICEELNISPALLFEDPEASCIVLRVERQKVLQFETVKDDMVYTKIVNMLSEPNKKLELVQIVLTPGSTAGDHAHAGEEIFFVLEGEVTITHGQQSHVLRAGDSAHIESQMTHKLHNHGSVPVKFISARTPPGFIDLRHEETLKSLRN
ncbi:MAG: cupin domain-containing protein [Sneathiellaceae bacterium]